jgi:hypothetical protein
MAQHCAVDLQILDCHMLREGIFVGRNVAGDEPGLGVEARAVPMT